MSMLRTITFTIIRVTGFILTFYFLGGPYYSILQAMYDAAIAEGIPSVTTYANWVYWLFYYGFAMIMLVFGPLVSIIYAYLVSRRRYYATDEVYA